MKVCLDVRCDAWCQTNMGGQQERELDTFSLVENSVFSFLHKNPICGTSTIPPALSLPNTTSEMSDYSEGPLRWWHVGKSCGLSWQAAKHHTATHSVTPPHPEWGENQKKGKTHGLR